MDAKMSLGSAGNFLETVGTIVVGVLAAVGTLAFTLSKADWLRRKTTEYAHDSSLDRMTKMNDLMGQRLDECDNDREALRADIDALRKTIRKLEKRVGVVEASTFEMRNPTHEYDEQSNKTGEI